MRAPAAAELLGDFVDTLAAEADDSLRYRDPDLLPPDDPNEIDERAMARVVEALNVLRMNDPERLGDWFGRFISAYRSGGAVAAPPGVPSRIEVEWDLAQGAVLLRHPFSRVAWRRSGRRATLFANGEAWSVPMRDAQRIAGAREIGQREYASLSEAGRSLAFELLEAGHYVLQDPEDGDGNGNEAGDE